MIVSIEPRRISPDDDGSTWLQRQIEWENALDRLRVAAGIIPPGQGVAVVVPGRRRPDGPPAVGPAAA